MFVNISQAEGLKQLVSVIAAGRQPNEFCSKLALADLGIKVPKGRVIEVGDIGAPSLKDLEGPLAVKLMSPEVLHKTDLGAVTTGVSAAEVSAVCQAMLSSPLLSDVSIEGFLVEEMARPGHEVVIGGLHDATFGPVVMVGIGGVFLEVLNDVAFRICPIDAADARSMLGQLRGFELLTGHRGSEPANIDALVTAIMAIGGPDGLLMGLHEYQLSVDVNPVFVNAEGAVAVDAMIRPEARPGTPSSSHDGAYHANV